MAEVQAVITPGEDLNVTGGRFIQLDRARMQNSELVYRKSNDASSPLTLIGGKISKLTNSGSSPTPNCPAVWVLL